MILNNIKPIENIFENSLLISKLLFKNSGEKYNIDYLFIISNNKNLDFDIIIILFGSIDYKLNLTFIIDLIILFKI